MQNWYEVVRMSDDRFGSKAAVCITQNKALHLGTKRTLIKASDDQPLTFDSLRHRFTGSSQFCWEIFLFGKPVLHRQNSLRVIHMNAGFELQARQRGRIYIDQAKRRMGVHEVATAPDQASRESGGQPISIGLGFVSNFSATNQIEGSGRTAW